MVLIKYYQAISDDASSIFTLSEFSVQKSGKANNKCLVVIWTLSRLRTIYMSSYADLHFQLWIRFSEQLQSWKPGNHDNS
ncbi:hypothetical protein Y1Q_0003162 [Alligator mississippiensis]|uniref:Uncharacterized protein n=1 Tax=Alligator mississippiensis TaxID=8496 RepID=A0A151MDN6_ALLMI|nr:hypothetical protein Y1Q_0003162 [Alligator mississippiensis]